MAALVSMENLLLPIHVRQRATATEVRCPPLVTENWPRDVQRSELPLPANFGAQSNPVALAGRDAALRGH